MPFKPWNMSCIYMTNIFFQMQEYIFSPLVWQPTLQLHGHCAVSVASPSTVYLSFELGPPRKTGLTAPHLPNAWGWNLGWNWQKSLKVHMANFWPLPINNYRKYLLARLRGIPQETANCLILRLTSLCKLKIN